jgi:hypothetical protein
MKKVFTLLFSVWTMSLLIGQNPSEMIRYSQQQLSGTAPSVAVANSAGALGGDFGIILQNPASIGVYRNSVFTISPSFRIQAAETRSPMSQSYLRTRESETSFNLDNIGLVFADSWKGGLNTFNFALGYNRIAKFDASYSYDLQSQGSIGTHFADLADGFLPEELNYFQEGLAYETYVIGLPETGFDYFSDFTDEDLVQKQGDIRIDGGINEFTLAMGASIEQKFSVGLKLGVPIVSYTEEILYTEINSQNIDVPFNRLEFDQYLNTSGIGFNTALGFIFAPVREVRLGMSVQTPTWYSMNDDFDSRLYFDYIDDPELFPEAPPQESFSPQGRFSYNVNTPWVVRGQGGFLINRKGFVSFELEYLDYGSGRFGYDPGFEQDERVLNRAVEDQLSSALNLKVGGEWALGDFRLRGGAAWFQNPFEDNNGYQPSYSGGFGYRTDDFFIDFAYRWAQNDFSIQPYQRLNPSDASTTVQVDQNNHQILLTLGFVL